MLEFVAALLCLAFSVVCLLGGLSDAMFDAVFRRSTEAQWAAYKRMGTRTTATAEGHARTSRLVMVAGGLVGIVACVSWLVSIAIRAIA